MRARRMHERGAFRLFPSGWPFGKIYPLSQCRRLAQSVTRHRATDAPGAPVRRLVSVALLQGLHDMSALVRAEVRQGFEQVRDGVRAELCGVSGVEDAPATDTRDVGPDNEAVGVHHMEQGQRRKPGYHRAEDKALALPSQDRQGKPDK